jgi:hypothetical protein
VDLIAAVISISMSVWAVANYAADNV